MSLLTSSFTAGQLQGIAYHFEKEGDILPMHSHDAATVHIAIIVRGRFKVHGPGWEQEASPGAVLDFEVGQQHEFIALEPDSRVINIKK